MKIPVDTGPAWFAALDRARRKFKESQTQFAARLGISQDTYRSWKAHPPKNMAIRRGIAGMLADVEEKP